MRQASTPRCWSLRITQNTHEVESEKKQREKDINRNALTPNRLN